MNKTELIQAVAKETGLSQATARKAIDASLKVASDTLAKGKDITLIGFGSFKVTKRKATTARNPRDGKTVKVPAKKVLKFKVGATLKDRVAAGK